jgi:hypothetical protein
VSRPVGRNIGPAVCDTGPAKRLAGPVVCDTGPVKCSAGPGRRFTGPAETVKQTVGRAVHTGGPMAHWPSPEVHEGWREGHEPVSAQRERSRATQKEVYASHAGKGNTATGLPVSRGHSAAAGALDRESAIPCELQENSVQGNCKPVRSRAFRAARPQHPPKTYASPSP